MCAFRNESGYEIFLKKMGNRNTQRKTSWSKGKKQQTPEPAYGSPYIYVHLSSSQPISSTRMRSNLNNS